jgi:hypothetical protein
MVTYTDATSPAMGAAESIVEAGPPPGHQDKMHDYFNTDEARRLASSRTITQHISSYSGGPPRRSPGWAALFRGLRDRKLEAAQVRNRRQQAHEVQGAGLRESFLMIGAIPSDLARARWSSFELLVAFRGEASVELHVKVPLMCYSTVRSKVVIGDARRR